MDKLKDYKAIAKLKKSTGLGAVLHLDEQAMQRLGFNLHLMDISRLKSVTTPPYVMMPIREKYNGPR